MEPTLAAVAARFLARPGLSPKTIRSYEGVLMPLLKQYGRSPVEAISRQDLVGYLDDLNHLSYVTHNRHQTVIGALFNFVVDKGLLSTNPIARLGYRKPDRTKGEHTEDDPIRYLTSKQLVLLYKLVNPNSRLHALIVLLHQTGARIEEILALDLEQIDFENREFKVVGKRAKSRWCYFAAEGATVLSRYIRRYRHSEHSALFTARHPITYRVTRLSYRTAYDDWRSLIDRKKELKGCRLHDLRHTFGTERVGLMQIEELSALMGHEDIRTTLRYAKATSARAKSVAQSALTALNKSIIDH